jgi:hypothetical protein
MSAISNRYKRGDLVGVGFECDYGGVRCHAIAWGNAQLERLRDDPVFTEGLVIDQFDLGVACGGPLVLRVPDFKTAEAQQHAIDALKEMNREVVLLPGGPDFQEVEALKARISELEGELAIARAFVNFPQESTAPSVGEIVVEPLVEPPKVADSVPVEAMQWHVDPEPAVIATHETIEPAVTETPVEPIQEPVVEVSAPSEPTDTVPALAPDTPAEVEAVEEATPEVAEEIIEEVEPWKPTPGDSESKTIQNYFKQFGIATPHKDVIAALKEFGIEVTSSQVLMAKKAIKQ